MYLALSSRLEASVAVDNCRKRKSNPQLAQDLDRRPTGPILPTDGKDAFLAVGPIWPRGKPQGGEPAVSGEALLGALQCSPLPRTDCLLAARYDDLFESSADFSTLMSPCLSREVRDVIVNEGLLTPYYQYPPCCESACFSPVRLRGGTAYAPRSGMTLPSLSHRR